jgi:hypothetical protein
LAILPTGGRITDTASRATAEGFATVARDGSLDAWFPEPKLTSGGGRPGTTRLFQRDACEHPISTACFN